MLLRVTNDDTHRRTACYLQGVVMAFFKVVAVPESTETHVIYVQSDHHGCSKVLHGSLLFRFDNNLLLTLESISLHACAGACTSSS